MIEYENLAKLNGLFIDELKAKLGTVVNEGQFILGNHVREFESKFANYCGTQFCAGVANGLDALTLALRAFNFKEGSEVLVPSNTYIATILSIINNRLTPVFVEPDLATFNLDPEGIEEAVTKKTVAVIVVHLYGKCCAMDEIVPIANKLNLKLIEDCAQAHGAGFKGKRAGSFGDFGAFSFYPTKNLGALGDGGCLTTGEENLNKEIEILRNYGSDRKNYNSRIGVNSRLDELQAAFLTIKLKKLDEIIEHKQKLASIYSKELKSDFIKPVVTKDYDDAHHIYGVRHPARDRVREHLLKSGIATEIHYPTPPHRQQALKEMFAGKAYPVSEEIHATIMSLPISFIHTEKDIYQVVEAMNKF